MCEGQITEDNLSVKCSCPHCESYSCFSKRRATYHFDCQICNQTDSCFTRNVIQQTTDQKGSIRHYYDDIIKPYLNAPIPKANDEEFGQLTEDEINYESERETLLETNQPPPQSLDEYLDRLHVNKPPYKFKQKPSSLSGYIDLISDKEYKQKVNSFKKYIQSLKEAKPVNRTEEITYTDNLKKYITQQRRCCTKVSGQSNIPKCTVVVPKTKCRKCITKCLVYPKPSSRNKTQIQSATVSYPIMNYKPEFGKQETQTSNVPCENGNEPCKTSVSSENVLFKYDLFKKFKEACKACSCKVCECIAPKAVSKSICKCKPCECEECKEYANRKSVSRVTQLSSTLSYSCKVYNDQNTYNKQEECACDPCACGICLKRSSVKDNDVSKPFKRRPPVPSKVPLTGATCSCTPCNCSQCLLNYFEDKRMSMEKYKNKVSHTTETLDEIYRYADSKDKPPKQNFVGLCTGTPQIKMGHVYETGLSRTCLCKECECLSCVKENAINSIKSSGLFSTVNKSVSRSYHENKQYKVCKACFQKNVPIPMQCSSNKSYKHVLCSAFDECTYISDCCSNPNSHLNICRCTDCRCERCIAHGLTTTYSSTLGAFPIKKGDVFTPLAYRNKIQKLKAEKASRSGFFQKSEPVSRVINSYSNTENEDRNYHCISKNINPKDVTSRPSVSRQAKRDMGTILTKSFNAFNILQCDAYVHSQDFNLAEPQLKNNFTSYRSPCSLHAVRKQPCSESDDGTSITPNKIKYLIRSYVELPKFLGLDTSITKQTIDNMSPKKEENFKSSHTITEISSSQITQNSTEKILKNAIEKFENNSCMFEKDIRSTNKVPVMDDNSCSESYAKIQPETSNNVQKPKPNTSFSKTDSTYEVVSSTNRPMKSFSTSAITTLEKLIFFSSEQMSNNRSSKTSISHFSNYQCMRVLQHLIQRKIINNIYSKHKSPNFKILDLTTKSDALINEDNENARKTLEDAKQFSIKLLNLLEMYEKANNEFVKISDKLRLAYKSVVEGKLAQSNEKVNNKLSIKSKSDLSIKDTTCPISRVVPKNETVSFDVISRRLNDIISNNISNTDLNKNETEDKAEVASKHDAPKKYERICYAGVRTERSKGKVNDKIFLDYNKLLPINVDGVLEELTRFDDIKPDINEPLMKSLEHLSRFTSTDTIDKDLAIPKMDEEVETQASSVCRSDFGITVKLSSRDEKSGLSEPSLKNNVTDVMTSASIHKNSAVNSHHKEPKGLNTLQLEVKRLLELAIQEPLIHLEENDDSLAQSSSLYDESLLNMDEDDKPNMTKSYSRPKPTKAKLFVDKEVYCSDEKLLDAFKKQIREQLKLANLHPPFSKTSFDESYSCSSDCDDLKARFLVVRKISEHTALLRWSQPHGVGVQGYELLVDGRIIQKIKNPSKCITAVTCLPHTDKILLTVRTITSVLPEVGHYPTTTIVYRPHQQ